MGCCYSSEAEASDQEEETKRLLEPAASPPNKALNGAEQSCHSLPSARTDEQAMLSSILAKTAINIIDVSAADSQGMEQHEYMDRARQYSTRLAMLSNNLTHWKKLPLLPSLTNQPHQVLASEPVPFTDLQQVSRIAAYAFSALSQIRVDAKEELVVFFSPPPFCLYFPPPSPFHPHGTELVHTPHQRSHRPHQRCPCGFFPTVCMGGSGEGAASSLLGG